ncbi:hypothetical protein BKI52_27155 [marine bacterium AO1-C]|nr:hypothetical protein BKI52_27155 [marine bacterium AO1-C]
MKLFLLSLILGFTLISCGGGAKKSENNDSTKTTDTTKQANTEEDTGKGDIANTTDNTSSDTETTMCFEAKGLTIVTTNFKIKGDQVTGTHYVRTPKSDTELYANFSFKGTKKGNTIDGMMTLIASNNLFGIGEPSKMSWVIKGDELVTPGKEDDIGGVQKKISCSEGTLFELKPQKSEVDDPFSGKYNLSGSINGKLKVKMYIETSKGDDPGTTAYKGWYYYESQGPDKKIQLKGVVPGAGIMDGEVKEFTNGKHSGSFMIPSATDLSQGLDCEWTDVAKSKALPVSLKLDSKM